MCRSLGLRAQRMRWRLPPARVALGAPVEDGVDRKRIADRTAGCSNASVDVSRLARSAVRLVNVRVDVETETLRTAAEQGWTDLQGLYRTSTLLAGDEFWQIRNEAAWLRRAMIHVCSDQGAAKRWQLELTPEPLTFCAGTPLGGLPRKPGCGRVFADTKRAGRGGRSYWLAWYPGHEKNRIAATRR
jgi:hypothetical protein